MSKSNKKHLSISNIKTTSWVLFVIYLIVAGYLAYYFIKPFKAERHFREGYNFYVLNRLKFAIEELELAVKYAPLETHYQIQLAKAYESMSSKSTSKAERIKWLRKAEAMMLNAQKVDEISPWFKSRLAGIYEKFANEIPSMKDTYLQKATDYHVQAARSDKSNPIFQLNYAYYLHQKGKFDEAIPFYERAREIDEWLLEASYNLGDIYRRRDNLDRAKKNYMNVFERNPSYNRINLILGSIYFGERDFTKALDHLQRDYLLHPKNKNAVLNLAAINHQVGRHEAAAFFYGKLLQIDSSQEKKIINNYVESLLSSNQRQKAKAVLVDYLTRYPNDAVAKGNLKKIQNAQ